MQSSFSAWNPPTGLPDHTGSPLSHDARFFAAPPPQIGPVLSAHSGTYQRDSAMNRPLARKVVGLFALLGIMVGGFLGFALAHGAWPGLLVGALLGGGLIGGILYRREGGKRDVTFVGTKGIARFKYPGSRPPAVLLFAEAAELQSAFLGRMGGTNFDFQWKDPQGRTLFKLEGGYYGNRQDGDPESLLHFARAAEIAWSDFLAPRMQQELERKGSVPFLTSRVLGQKQYASLGPGFLELTYAGRLFRLSAGEIELVLVFQGLITIRTRGARNRAFPSPGKDGIFRLSYGSIANVRLFLTLLETVVGVSCRYEDG